MNPSRQTFLTILLLGLHASFGFQATSLEEDNDAPKHRSFFRKNKVFRNFDSDAAHYKEDRLDQESSLCAIENEKSLACNSKKGKDVCCPGLVCHHYQYWRCVDEENIHCSGLHAAAQECGGWKNSSPFCCDGLVCDGKFCRVPPTDEPTNSPTNVPANSRECPHQECIDRCIVQYKGDGTSGRSYYCSKGCAGVSGGQVRNPYRFCNIEEAERYDTCVVGCEGASSSEENKGYCRYGCEFWTTPIPNPSPTPNPTPSIDLAWTTTTKYCAGKNKFRHCKAYPSYATEEWCIKFAKENGMMAVEYFVAYGNPTCQFYIEPWQTCGSFNIPGYYQTWSTNGCPAGPIVPDPSDKVPFNGICHYNPSYEPKCS